MSSVHPNQRLRRQLLAVALIVQFVGLVVAFVLSRSGIQVVIGTVGVLMLLVLSTSGTSDAAALMMSGIVGLSITLAWDDGSFIAMAAVVACGVAAIDIAAMASRVSGLVPVPASAFSQHIATSACIGGVAAFPVIFISLFGFLK